jgi:hypothetical protein
MSFLESMDSTQTNKLKGMVFTMSEISIDRIQELTCFTDDALAAMTGTDGYYDFCNDVYLKATLEEVAAVFIYRAEKDREWIRSLDPESIEEMVSDGVLSADEVKAAMGSDELDGVETLAVTAADAAVLRVGEPRLTLAKRPATKPALVAHDDCRREVAIGDTVLSFRGEAAKLLHLSRANETGRDGKVVVAWLGDRGETQGQCEYYAGVFNLTVSEAGRMQVGG